MSDKNPYPMPSSQPLPASALKVSRIPAAYLSGASKMEVAIIDKLDMPPGASGRLSTAFVGGMNSIALGETGGEQVHALSTEEIASIYPQITDGIGSPTFNSESTADMHNNVQPTLLLNKIIFTGV
jgi:hypothetical protein